MCRSTSRVHERIDVVVSGHALRVAEQLGNLRQRAGALDEAERLLREMEADLD